jgi:hypothetical protein
MSFYEGDLLKTCKQPISHGRARKRTDSHFICQPFVNREVGKSDVYLLSGLVRREARSLADSTRNRSFDRLDILEAEFPGCELSGTQLHAAINHRPNHVVNGLASVVHSDVSLIRIVYCHFEPILIEVNGS